MFANCARWVIFVLLALFAYPGLSQQQAGGTLSPYQQSWLKEHPVISVGVYANNWPPFEVVGEGGHSGMTFAYLDALTRHLGVTYRVKKFPTREALMEAACQGEIDLVLGVSFTADSSKCLVFTESYFHSPTFIIGRKRESRAGIGSNLAGLRIVTEAGYAEHGAARIRYPNAIHLTTTDTVTALEMVRDGKADLYLGDPFAFATLSRAHGIEGLELLRQSDIDVGALYFATPDSRKTLAEALDLALLQMTQDDHRAIRDEWLPVLDLTDRNAFVPSEAERQALQTPLRLLVMTDMDPISLVDEEGVPDGLAAEYLRRFEAIGAHFTITTADNWREARERMRLGEVDAVLSIPAPVDNDPHWVYSIPYLNIPNVIVNASNARRILDMGDLNHKRVALSDPVRLTGPLLAQAPRAQIVSVGNYEEGLEAVRRGSVDAYIGNLVLVDRLIREKYVGRLQVAAPTNMEDRISFAFSRKHAAVASAFDRMLVSIPLRERQAIRGDWLSVEYDQHGLQWRSILKWAIPLLLFLVAAGIAQNVSNMRLRREVAQRREVEQRLDRVTANLPAVVYRLERAADGKLSLPYIAGDMQALFGLSVEAALGDMDEVISRIHPEDVALVLGEIEVSARELSFLDVEFRSNPALGLHWIQAKGRPSADDNGKVSWSGYWIDVTQGHLQAEDLRAAKSAAEAAVSAKAEFLATMSHEIRTPMSGILGFLEMLEQTDPDVEQRRILQVIGESAQVLSQILDDILDYSKIEAGAMELDPTPVDIRQAMDHVQRMLAAQAAEKGLRVSVYADPGLSKRHYMDGVRLKQILFNLLSNAIKFTSRGEIAMSLKLEQKGDGLETVRLSVRDTGIGISDDQQERLFQPFSQAESSITRRFGGTGLGLSICRRLVELMHGSLSLDSALGVGTTVTVELTLPVASLGAQDESPAGGEVAQAGPAPLAARRNRRILVAEDHPTNQMLMRWRLGQLGLQCDIVADGALALEALAANHYDVLITDCQMPVMDGYELTREIRRREAEHQLPRLPIIAMTASVLDEDVADCMRAGMDDFLAKPVPLNELKNTLGHWLVVARDAQGAQDAEQAGRYPVDAPGGAWVPDIAAMNQIYGSATVVTGILESLCVTTHQDLARAMQARDEADQDGLLKVMHRMVGSLGVLANSPAALRMRDLMQQIDGMGLSAAQEKIDEEFAQLRGLLSTLRGILESTRAGQRH